MSQLTGVTTPVGTSRGEAGVPTGHRRHQPCGTPAAARRHHKRGEELDPACREAFRQYHREYRRQARELEVFRRREREAGVRWEQRVKADPMRRARRRRQQREAEKRRQAEFRNYVDPVVLDRLVRGESTNPTRRERLAAVAVLRNRGATYSAIAERLGISARQVHRDLRDMGLVRAA